MYADENVIKIKHDVLYEVAKLAFAGELDEKRDNIAMSLIPGPRDYQTESPSGGGQSARSD